MRYSPPLPRLPPTGAITDAPAGLGAARGASLGASGRHRLPAFRRPCCDRLDVGRLSPAHRRLADCGDVTVPAAPLGACDRRRPPFLRTDRAHLSRPAAEGHRVVASARGFDGSDRDRGIDDAWGRTGAGGTRQRSGDRAGHVYGVIRTCRGPGGSESSRASGPIGLGRGASKTLPSSA